MWSKFKDESPTYNTYIICRNNSGCYIEGRYDGNGAIEVANKSYYYYHNDDYWIYLPKEFRKKKEVHIWLDFSGGMPKDCCITYKSLRERLKEDVDIINTTQTAICFPAIFENNYKVFIFANGKKKEITRELYNEWGDNIIRKIAGEWNI